MSPRNVIKKVWAKNKIDTKKRRMDKKKVGNIVEPMNKKESIE